MSESSRVTGKPWRVAVLGLGIIGSRAADRLAAAGCATSRWNRTPKHHPDEHSTAADAAKDADVVMLFLKNGSAVRDVARQILPVIGKQTILLNHSTIDLDTTLWLADACLTAGIGFLDCPFTGSRDAAAAGNLVFYCGGPAAILEQVEPLLQITGKDIFACGDVGSATVIKLATNLIGACTVQALAEAMAIVTRYGIKPALFTDAVSRNASASPLAAMKLAAMSSADFTPHFSLDNMRKDSVYALELARSKGLQTPSIATVSARMTELCEAGLGELDFSALAKPYLGNPPA